MFDLQKIDDHFPMASYREGQKEAIEFAAKAFNDGKKIVILECPTGSGKSPIGMTLMDMVNKSYYLTITKVLQDQLKRDFGDNEASFIEEESRQIVELKGRNAYPCTFFKRHGQGLVDKKLWSSTILRDFMNKNPNCANGFCRTKWNGPEPGQASSVKKFKCDKCFPIEQPRETQDNKIAKGNLHHLPPHLSYSTCPYYEQVYKAVFGRKVVMNFSSFLFQTTLTNRFDKRDLLIIDECHQTEPQLLDFVSLSINDLQLQRYGIFIPELDDPLAYAVFFEEAKVGLTLIEIIKEARAEDNRKLEDDLSRMMKKYQLFMTHITESSSSEWVCEYEEKKSGGTVSFRTVTLRPVFAMQFPDELLFGYAKRILMMSATVLDIGVMCRSLGIDREDVAAYRMKNRFPVKNRPIYYQPVAKLTGGKDKMANWIPKVIKGVDKLMDKYPDDKGIIHTHNFAIMDNLINKCKPSSKARFLDQRKFNHDKAKMLRFHAESENTVIVAPAMHEGIDLTDDLSRFQIICKVPYANCFDNEQLARRVEIDRKYYTWLTALKLCQSYGRSVRSMDDYADTYIIDEAFTRFKKEAKSMLPQWFLEAIIEG